jgi:hypothetical protein
MSGLPAAVLKEPVFSAMKDAALSWKSNTTCFFKLEHCRRLERGDHGSPFEFAEAVYYAVEYCALCGEEFSSDSVDLLETAAQYLVHLKILDGQRLVQVHSNLAIIRENLTTRAKLQPVFRQSG